ncbi:MAG TPA: HD domain-containing protein [Dehalococcoidia bacterium]|jgi:hypothetical protein|nr:HD domain-containing protein [Dehalococcoidia bacterium]
MIQQRVHQFFQAGRRPTPEDFELAEEWLSPTLFELFVGQHPRDVVHSVSLARWLLEQGHREPDLVVAALVHDIGKGNQRRADRVAYVMAQWARSDGFAGDHGSRFEIRRAIARSANHSERGAALLSLADAPPVVIELTRLHHSKTKGDAMLDLLQKADSLA